MVEVDATKQHLESRMDRAFKHQSKTQLPPKLPHANLRYQAITFGLAYARVMVPIRVGDEAKVKRLFWQADGKIRVESYNALTEFIGLGDDAKVLGHVVDRKGTSNSNGG